MRASTSADLPAVANPNLLECVGDLVEIHVLVEIESKGLKRPV